MPLLQRFVLLGCLLWMPVCGFSQTLTGALTASCIQDTAVRHEVGIPFFSVLTDAINKAIASQYKARLTLIALPSQGNLMWYYQNMNGAFNQGTFDYVSARVSNGSIPYTAELSASGGFPNAYSQVISSLYYSLSTADQQKLSSITMAAQPWAAQLISTYESTFGRITDEEIDSAVSEYGTWVQTKLDYVIDVVAGARWSGRQASGLPPLSYTQMAAASDLPALLPDTPPDGAETVTCIAAYLDKIRRVTILSDSAANGAWTIQQLKNNTGFPNTANGGMQTVNPYTGALWPGYQVGYQVTDPLWTLNYNLTNTDRNITIVMHIKKGPNVIRIRTAWDANTIDTFSYSLPDSVYIDIPPLLNGPSDQTIKVVYYGFTLLSTGPTFWSDKTNTGWYFAYPLNQAIRNDTQDVTGYKFASWPPPYNMNPYNKGGNFGNIESLLICNYQQISTTLGYPGNTADEMIPPALPAVPVSVPLLQQTAYVIGGTFRFPVTGN